MTSSQNYLQDSVRKFNEKKQACLAYIDEVSNLTQEFEKIFPSSGSGTSGDQQGLSLKTLGTLRQKIQDSRLKILVAGQFKAGKSTMVNALLGEEVLPAYSTPCTAVITEIEYGEEPRAVLSFKQPLGEVPDDLYNGAKEHIERYRGDGHIPDLEISGINLGEELENYLVIPMSDKEQKESVAESPYATCRLFWPFDLCRNGVVIIDSPGLNEASARDKTTMDYVPQADIILHVLNALQCYGKPDEDFIRSVKIVGNPSMIFIVNRYDQINNDKERERLRYYALSRLRENSTYGESGIFFLSSQKALDARMNGDGQALERSGLLDFEQKIADIFDRERGKIKFANVRYVCDAIDTVCNTYIPSIKKLLGKNVEELECRYNEQKNKFDKLDERRKHIKIRMIKRTEELQREIDFKIKNRVNDFIHNGELHDIIEQASLPDLSLWDSFFNSKEHVKKCADVLGEAIENGLRKSVEEWDCREGTQIIHTAIEDLNNDIRDDMEIFVDILQDLRSRMELPKLSPNVRLNEIGVGEFLSDVLEGAAVGGGLSCGVLFVASRFLPAILGGPLGWGIAGLVTLLSAIIVLVKNLLTNEDPNKKLREEFYSKICGELYKKGDEFADALSKAVGKAFEVAGSALLDKLEQQIEDVKQPIEKAILALKDKREDTVIKQKEIERFAGLFLQEKQKGEALMQSL